jgi:hypothetical protein
MHTDTKRFPVAALLLGAVSYLGAAETSPLDPQQVYVQKATWSETMLATRANCADWAKTAPEFKLQGTSVVAVWSRIAQDWPAQCGWFTRDLSVGSDATAHNTGLQIPGSSSINIARAVLGTVPVEPDGSAYFTVPAGKELFFQALDEQGLVVTSMRSGTQFQPGETAMCQGCHEPRHGTVPAPAGTPLAMRRAPSRPQPDVDGTNPFSYPRLVQPVLDQH